MKHFLSRALCLGIAVLVALAYLSSPVSAARSTYCDGARTLGGRAECYGYFTNVDGYVAGLGLSLDSVIVGGVSATTVDTFVTFYYNKLNAGSYEDQYGAAFVILTMMGVSGPDAGGGTAAGITKARGLFSAWEGRVRAYASTTGYGINFNYTYTTPADYANSARALNGVNDIVYHKKAAETIVVIRFYDPSGTVAMIQRDCSNMIGATSFPPPPPASWSISGSSHITLNSSDPGAWRTTDVNVWPGQYVVFAHNLTSTGTGPLPTVWWTVSSTDEYQASFPTVASGSDPSFGIGGKQMYFGGFTVPATASAGQKFCQRIAWNPKDSSEGGDGFSNIVCAAVVYDYELNPSVTTSTTTLVGTNATFNFAMNNTGPTKTNSTVTAIREIIIPSGVSFPKNIGGYNEDVDCSNYAVGGVTCTTLEVLPAQVFPVGATPLGSRTASTVGRNPGDRVCRVLSVISRDETPGLAGPPWHNRDQVNCTVIAAAPFMAGVGADMSAGGAIMAQCTGLPNPNPGDTNGDGKLTMADCPAATPPATAPCIGTAGFTGAGSSIGVATPFGSFGDYGIIATGPVSNFVSGAQMAPSAQSYLTFANTPTLGGYRDKHCITDYAQAYKDTVSATAAGGWTTWGAAGVKNINSPSFSLGGTTITKGQVYTIYAPNSVITITGNINYSPNNITRFGEAPSLTIIAKKIVVNSDVTLLNGVFYASELFSTCAQATDLTTNSATADKTAISATGACRPQLTINGAVIAKKLLPLRTAGGTNPSTPAEIIRLRPDAFLRARDTDTGAILTVDMISELPQRN